MSRDDRRPQRSGRMRERRAAMPGRDLLGDRRAADDGPPFEHERLVAGLREVEGRDEAVVAGADDDDGHCGFEGRSQCSFRRLMDRSRRVTSRTPIVDERMSALWTASLRTRLRRMLLAHVPERMTEWPQSPHV